MNPLKNIANNYSAFSRKRRALVLTRNFFLNEKSKILDLGSESGANINMVLSDQKITPSNVYIADIDSNSIHEGHLKYGYIPVPIPSSGKLPFPDKFFDLVYCSSVIEHVTINKSEIWNSYSGEKFKSNSIIRQLDFAGEIQRLGVNFFVQTPYKYFPIESHSWLPFASYIPRFALIPLLRFTNLFWIKKTQPDWNLLDKKSFSSLFEGATIIEEKSFGLTKSLMAISKADAHAS